MSFIGKLVLITSWTITAANEKSLVAPAWTEGWLIAVRSTQTPKKDFSTIWGTKEFHWANTSQTWKNWLLTQIRATRSDLAWSWYIRPTHYLLRLSFLPCSYQLPGSVLLSRFLPDRLLILGQAEHPPSLLRGLAPPLCWPVPPVQWWRPPNLLRTSCWIPRGECCTIGKNDNGPRGNCWKN